MEKRQLALLPIKRTKDGREIINQRTLFSHWAAKRPLETTGLKGAG